MSKIYRLAQRRKSVSQSQGFYSHNQLPSIPPLTLLCAMGCNKLGAVKKWIPYDTVTMEPGTIQCLLSIDQWWLCFRYTHFTGTSSPCREQLDHIVEASSKIQKEKKRTIASNITSKTKTQINSLTRTYNSHWLIDLQFHYNRN